MVGVEFTLAGVGAAVVGLATTAAASAVVGVCAGLLLLGFGALALVNTIRTPVTRA